VNPSAYLPKSADLVWVDYNSPVQHEHKERLLACVVSEQSYNAKTGRAIICIVTSEAKGYPFEVMLPESCNITGVILSDHVRTVDWQTSKLTYAGVVDHATYNEVAGKLAAVLGM
jgi:mRNA interferase MazF